MTGAKYVQSLTGPERKFFWRLHGAVENVAIESGDCTCRGWEMAVDPALIELADVMLDAAPHGSSLREYLNRAA